MDLARFASPKPAQNLAAGYGYGQGVRAKKTPINQIIMTVLSIIVAVCIGLSILRMRHPDIYYNITLSMDVFGLSADNEQEKKRINKIALLPISDEKKDFLIKHSIFMGATPRMVKLALGDPRMEQHTVSQQNAAQPVLVYVYHFPQDSRPTLLMFEEDKLVAAQKSSVTDVSYSQNTVPVGAEGQASPAQ